MSDMNRFWDSISKLGDQLGQVSMYNYTQKKEEERTNRERDVAQKRSDTEWSRRHGTERAERNAEITRNEDFTVKMANLAAEHEMDTYTKKKLYDAQEEAMLGDPDLAREGMQVSASLDPVGIQAFGAKMNVIHKVQAGGELTPEEEQIAATLGPSASGKLAELKMRGETFRQSKQMNDVQIGYYRMAVKKMGEEGASAGALLGFQKDLEANLSAVAAIEKDPVYGALLDREASGKLTPGEAIRLGGYRKEYTMRMEGAETVQNIIDSMTVKGVKKQDTDKQGTDTDRTQETIAAPEVVTAAPRQSLLEKIGDIGPNLVNKVGDFAGEVFSNRPDPLEPARVLAEMNMLRKQYGVPKDATVHLAKPDGKVQTQDKDGSQITIPLEDLKFYAKSGDHIWDAGKGIMYDLGLYLNQKGKTPGFDEEDIADEIFK